VLLYFQNWIWWSVPPREAAMAWGLYLPVCAAVLLLVWMLTLVLTRESGDS
jgi:hypothetical protein